MSTFQEDVENYVLEYWNLHLELPPAVKVEYSAPSQNSRKLIVETAEGKTEELIFDFSSTFTIMDISNRIDQRARA